MSSAAKRPNFPSRVGLGALGLALMLSGATATAYTVAADRNRATADKTKIIGDVRTVEVSQDIVSSRELKSLQQDELAEELVDLEKRGEARVVLRAKVTARNRWPKKLVVPVDDSTVLTVDVFPRLANAAKDVYLTFLSRSRQSASRS